MSLLPLFCLTCCLINLVRTSSDVCAVISVKNGLFQRGKRLQGFQYYTVPLVPNIHQCAQMCFFRRRCLSFNYYEYMSFCEFNNARVDPPYAILNTSNDYFYSDIDDWDKSIGLGPCQNQPCGICEVCHPTGYNYTCVKEELTSCRDIKICTNASSDGHYLVRPDMGTRPSLKVYCYKMNTNYPREYITLIKDNYAIFPPYTYYSCSIPVWKGIKPGIIFYHKIRLDHFKLRVIADDKTFTNISCEPGILGISDPLSFLNSGQSCSVDMDYGVAGHCMLPTCNKPRGIINIDLTGTGLSFSSCLKWTGNCSTTSIDTFYRSFTNERIKISCGGSCGSCHPIGDIFLQQNP